MDLDCRLQANALIEGSRVVLKSTFPETGFSETTALKLPKVRRHGRFAGCFLIARVGEHAHNRGELGDELDGVLRPALHAAIVRADSSLDQLVSLNREADAMNGRISMPLSPSLLMQY